jgi:hypothetical protein
MDTVIPLDILTSVFGSGIGGDIEKSLAGAVGAVGGLFDGALDFIPVMDFLPGGGDIAGIYGRLPEDELKAQYDQLIAAQPTARLEYMKQYLDRRGADIARMHGFSGDMGELAGPSSSFSEQLRRIIFGGLMLAGNQTAKAYINNGSLRDVEGTILNKDDSLLPAELVEMKQRLENGEITRDEFNDELSAGQFRWTHDTGAGGMFINLVMDIVSDPLIWASFGIGGVAKAGASGAVRTAMLRTTQAVRKAGMEERMAAALSRTHRMAPEDIIKSGSDEMLKAKYEWAKQNAGTAYQEGIASMGRTQRTLYKLDPVIKPAAKVANEVDSLFGMFGATHVGRRLSAFRGVKHVEGVSRAVGVKRVQRTQNFFGPELFDDFTSWFGIATANLSGKLSQKLEVDSLLAHNRAVDQAGNRIGGLMKDPDVTPTQAAKSFVAGSMEEGLPREAEQAFLQYMETFLPHGEQTAAGVQAAMRQAKEALAADLAAAKGTDVRTALKHLDGADRRELAFLHFVLYGRQVKMFNLAKLEHVQSIKGHLDNARRAGDDAEVARLTDELADAERLTLVSENLLTRSDAQTVLAAVHSPGEAGVRAAKQAVERFDQLDINWGGRAMDGEALRIELKQHLEAMLAEEGRLTSVIDPSAVNPRIAGSLDTRYRVGHAPTDVWGIVRDADGTIKSVNPFVEAMSNVDSSLSRNLSWYDRMKQGLAGPMSGARLHAEAKMRMRVVAATEFGMRKQDADALFNAINRESIIRQKGARGFGAHELNEIAKQASVTLDPSLHVKYGDRAILDLVLRAYEGDLAMLGTSSHLSSRVKSKFGRLPLGDNLLGKIAEDFYPKLRFSASPIFLAMEWVEGPFFAILRGVKPGWRYGADDVRMNSILRTIQPAYAENGAGIGRAQLAYGDNIGAMKVSQASMMTRTWNKLMPAKFKRNPVRLQGPRWYNVYEMKKLLYVRQAGKDASRRWTAQMKREFPDALHQWEQAAGSTKPEKVFMAFMEERGAFDPSARHALHMFDAAKPDSMGKERIRMGDVAQWQGHTTAAAMREAINNGSLTESQFMTRYTAVGMNETYARRAWNIASGFTEAEWDAALVEALGKEAAEGAINFHRWIANAKGISIEEFLNDEYGQVAQTVARGRLVPGVALKQTVRASLEGINATVHERGSKLHTAAKRRSSEFLPNTEDLGDPTNSKTLPGKIAVAQRSNANGKGMPPSLPPELAGLLSDDLATREAVYQDMFAQMRGTFGGDDASMRAAANWYDEMTTMFLGLVEKMPDSAMDALMRSWEENAPASMRKGIKKMTKEEKQVELAARLNIAFSGSQMNVSVLEGMKKVAGMLEEIVTEANRETIIRRISERRGITMEAAEAAYRTRYGFEVVVGRLESVLKDFGKLSPEKIAQKLSDFNDNLAGRTTRTSSPVAIDGVALQPAAMDIWMKRIFGHGDNAYLGYLTDDYLRATGTTDRVAAEAAVRKHHGWADGDLGKPVAPQPNQYEWMLRRTNEFKDWLNKEGIDGPNGEWSAHEIQAMLWVGEQKRLLYEGTPTFGTLTQTGSQISVDRLTRHPGVVELTKSFGDEAPHIINSVQRDVNTALMGTIAEKTGVTVLRQLDGVGDGATNVVFAGREHARVAAAHLAASLDEPVVQIGKGSSHHALDISFDPVLTHADVQPYLPHLMNYLEQYLPQQFTHASSALLDDNAIAIRNVSKKAIADDYLPPNIIEALENGTWVHAFDPDAAALPVHTGIGKVDFNRITPEEGRAIVGDDTVVRGYRTDADAAIEGAYARYAPEDAANREVRGQAAGTLPQREPGGAVRAGFKPATNAEKAALYFVNNAVDATSGVHEAFHLFARHIDGSAKRELIDAYNRAHGLTGRQRKRSFSVVEEWVAAEFEAFAAGDIRPDATYAGTFKSFAEWGQKHPGIRRGSVVAPVFDRVLEAWADTPGGFTSLDERRIWESARISLLRAEEEAHATAYYRRSPNFIGRSLNHPYLGMYPANYMWGKVLPELTRFLLRKPFGVNAPLGGMMMYNHVHRAIAEQLATDEDFNQYIEDHPDTIRFMTMMLPGNPVEMPVNLPVVARRAMEHDAENRARVHAGQEPEQFDLAGSVGDMVSYSVGYANLAGRVGDMFGEWAGGDGPNAGRTAPRYEITDDVL